MQIQYTQGPPTVTMGAAGTFHKGEPREIENDLAAQLLRKKTIIFSEAAPAAPPSITPEPDSPAPSAAPAQEEMNHGSN